MLPRGNLKGGSYNSDQRPNAAYSKPFQRNYDAEAPCGGLYEGRPGPEEWDEEQSAYWEWQAWNGSNQEDPLAQYSVKYPAPQRDPRGRRCQSSS